MNKTILTGLIGLLAISTASGWETLAEYEAFCFSHGVEIDMDMYNYYSGKPGQCYIPSDIQFDKEINMSTFTPEFTRYEDHLHKVIGSWNEGELIRDAKLFNWIAESFEDSPYTFIYRDEDETSIIEDIEVKDNGNVLVVHTSEPNEIIYYTQNDTYIDDIESQLWFFDDEVDYDSAKGLVSK